MRNGKEAETDPFLVESLVIRSVMLLPKNVHVIWLLVYSFFLSLNIYNARYCASTGDTMANVTAPALKDTGVDDGGQ